MVAAKAKSAVFPWKKIFLISTALSALVLFPRVLDWGTSGDDGFYYYTQGFRTWGDILHQLFLPGETKVFVFGEVRPFQYLFYKISYELGLGHFGFHAFAFILAWLSCISFSWGMIALIRRAFVIPPEAMWLLACLSFWVPSQTFSAAHNLCDIWMLGFIGTFWGLAYSEEARLHRVLRRPALRWGLAGLAVLLGLQTHEASWTLLGWTSIWLLAVSLSVDKARLMTALKTAAIPTLLVVAHILLYRSLSPGERNRFEIAVSTDPLSMLSVSRHYLVMGLYAVAKPFTDWFNIRPTAYGVGTADLPVSFLLCTLAWIGVFMRRPTGRSDAQKQLRLSWLILLGGILSTAPYFMITNRQLIYYSLRLNFFVSAFFVLRAYADWKGKVKTPKSPLFKPQMMALAYLLGVGIAGWNAVAGWNMVEYFSGGMKSVHQRAIALPDSASCTSEKPCCLEIPGSDWGNNVWVVNWLDGPLKRPRFLEPGMACEKTLRL